MGLPLMTKLAANKSYQPLNVRNLLKRFGIRPNKRLGQNFLVDHRSLEKVVKAAVLEGDERILEVGAGVGSLTRLLSKNSREVFAIELDRRLIPALRVAIQDAANVRIIEADILKLDIAELVSDFRYSVVANIPYYLTSALIRKLLEGSKPADRIVITIQREVAERILAPAGKYGLLTLSVQMYGEAKIAGFIPAKAFYPSPKVESAILVIQVHSTPKVDVELIQPIFTLAKAGFSQKRKQLRNSLSSGLGRKPEWAEEIMLRVGIDPKQRAQELQLEEWVALAGELNQESN
jgi:16S rRNA (adenine1518-N6/adenine1519-N6)-dimethyltransferase